MAAIRAVGWIGLGKMGVPICIRRKDAGLRVRALCRNAEAEAVATTHDFEIAVTSGDCKAAFSAAQMPKDFDSIAEATSATSCEMPPISGIQDLYREAVAQGLGRRDVFVSTAGKPDAPGAEAKFSK